ncbi:MAG TPA: peptidoglycan-binding domain-containing protein [Streptosporangiaceae bacterium]|nr:peptidoglycan-binding domain-containing protein [Streptosporangiaceae bacterium]
MAVPLAAAMAGAVVAVAVRGSGPAPATPASPPVSTAAVVRTDLATTVLTAGTLGYAPTYPLVNHIAGTYTWLPAAGAVITPGRVLYRVDDLPVVLMAGRTPAWRPFALGMTGGPDVRQLQANLIAGGYAAGLLRVPTGQFDGPTADAVERWQTAHGYLPTGEMPLGQVVFLPAAIRVGAPEAAPGQNASPGQAPYLTTTGQRTVTVQPNPNLPAVRVGEAVSIVLPTTAATPGTVTATGGTSTTAAPSASAQLIVTPDHPAATGTAAGVAVQVALPVESVRAVLAVPVAALLALAGGGYGLEVVSPSGRHRLVGVTTGIFAGGRVQVSGPGIAPGTRVVTTQ